MCHQQNDDRGSKFISTSTIDSSSCSPLSLPPLHFAPPRTTAYCHCAHAELQNTMTDATPTASNVSHVTSEMTVMTTGNVIEVDTILHGF
jgi:hypothetical protein